MSWPKATLDEICEINVGRTPPRDNRAYWDDGIHPWVSISDMTRSRHINGTKECFSEQARRECNMKVVPAGTVLMSFKLSIGKVAFAERAVYTNEAIAALPVRDVKKLDSQYLARALEYLNFDGTGKRAVLGMTLNKASLRLIKIPLPPLPEQRRIAAILDQADALHRLRRQSLTRLADLGQAIFEEMFGDTITNPKGWNRKKLGDLCEVGSSKRVFVSEFVPIGVPFYRGTEVGKLAADQSITPDLHISPAHYDALSQQSGRPKIGDLLMPSICHDGRIWRVDHDKPFYFKDGRVLWIKCSSGGVDSEYLQNQLRGMFLKSYHQIASGTTFAELKIVNLKSLMILVPPLSVQREFSERMRGLQVVQIEAEASSAKANNLFTSLQHRAFNGEL